MPTAAERPVASAPESLPQAAAATQGAAKVRLAPAAATPDPAPSDPRIEPSAALGDAAPGRAERTASETPVLASRPPAPAPVAQLAMPIAGAAARRIERLVVHLEPAALGRVEVRLDFSHDNRVSALIAADRSDTLDLLQRDSRALERSLQDAGLRLDHGALSFSLRQEQRGQERGPGTPGPWPRFEAGPGPARDADRQGEARPPRWIGAYRLLDIRI